MMRTTIRALALLVVEMFALGAMPGTLAAGTYYVDGASSSCSFSGPGTPAVPYCTIQAAANVKGGPGTTLLVKPAVYREQVTVPSSGAQGSPFVIKALGAAVVLDGADNFSIPSKWHLTSGTVYLAPTVVFTPMQVFADGARLVAATSAVPAAILPGTFLFVSGDGLYVNIGGDNPGTHATFVGRRSNGFRVTGRSWVTIEGFTVSRPDDTGIYLSSSSSHVTIVGNTIGFAGNAGIAATGCTDLSIESNTVADSANHGISFSGGVSDSTIKGNDCARSARATGVAANGIKLDTVARVLVSGNRLHANQDSGLQINHCDYVTSLQNRSWDNGDHGYDHLDSRWSVHVGDVAYHNVHDGFSLEGGNANSALYDSVAVDNGVLTNHYNLWVDLTSTPGFASDSNILWNSMPQEPVKYITTPYSSVFAFYAITGHDEHSIQADPLFVDPANGDFRLRPGSPAIDSADSSAPGWAATDAEGNTRISDPYTPDTGSGLVPYADRGALEFIPACSRESCDGIDNDCNNIVDDGFDTGAACTVGVGACRVSGHKVCSEDGSTTVCAGLAGTPAPERCGDLIDNDCDGEVDEGFDTGAACTVGLGACRAAGYKVCAGDGTTTACNALPGTPAPETCDRIDNNCDGVVDEGFGTGAACALGVGACQASGHTACSADGSTSVCDALAGAPAPETCDGLDNDCNGAVDEGFETGVPCAAGLGACQAAGHTVCSADGTTTRCGAVLGQPAPEACDGLDNDCDGRIDNDAAPATDLTLGLAQLAGTTRIAWRARTEASGYDVVKGDLGVLNESGGDFAAATTQCLADDGPAAFIEDPALPAENSGYFYLVRGVNACGRGRYDTAGAGQVGSRDSEIAASVSSCP